MDIKRYFNTDINVDLLPFEEQLDFFGTEMDIEAALCLRPEHMQAFSEGELIPYLAEKLSKEVLGLSPEQEKIFTRYFKNAMRHIHSAFEYRFDALYVRHDRDEGFRSAVMTRLADDINKTIKFYTGDFATVALSLRPKPDSKPQLDISA